MPLKVSAIILILIFLTPSDTFSGIDKLIKPSPKTSDTAQISTYIRKAKEFEIAFPDTSLYLLGKAMQLAKGLSPGHSKNLAQLHTARVLASKGRVNSRYFRDLQLARAQTDSAVLMVKEIQPKLATHNEERLARECLSVSYGTLGRLAYFEGDFDGAKHHFYEALRNLNGESQTYEAGKIYNNLGVINLQQSDYTEAITNLLNAQQIFTKLNDSLGLAGVLVNFGVVSHNIGVYEVALEHYINALSIYDKHHDRQSLASTLINIGDVFVNTKSEHQSIAYYHRAKHLYSELNDANGLASANLTLGICHTRLGNIDSANHYLSNALLKFRELGDLVGQASALEHLGEVSAADGKLSIATDYLRSSVQSFQEAGIPSYISIARIKLARVLLKQGNIAEARNEVEKALKESIHLNQANAQRDAYEVLSQIYGETGDFRRAYLHHKHYSRIRDSILSFERSNKIIQMEAIYRLRQKDDAISALERESAKREFELSESKVSLLRKRNQLYLATSALVIIVMILVVLYTRYKLKEKSNRLLRTQYAEITQKNEEILTQNEEIFFQSTELEKQKRMLIEKNEELERFNWLISQSITYASNIQMSLMPSHEMLYSYFPDIFTIFFPKDVVSGDFYWAYPFDDSIIVALGDCTGHGVPGGFMSMLGNTALAEIMGRNITDPAEILDSLRILVIDSLNQSGKSGEQQDGMDMSIIRYAKDKGYIEFAGANHPIWIARENGNSPNGVELIELKGDSMPISYHRRMKPFTKKHFDVKPNDTIYLFSDGFRDQLGGPDRNSKFGLRQYKNLIEEVALKPLDDQKSIIENTFFLWASGQDQVDDITIIGLRI